MISLFILIDFHCNREVHNFFENDLLNILFSNLWIIETKSYLSQFFDKGVYKVKLYY